MTGLVDSSGRALIRVRVKHPTESSELELEIWIDTGFTGELVLPSNHVASLGLPLGPAVKAALADGSEIQLDAYTCLIDWFGEWKRIEVVANQGRFPLLGFGLLRGRVLHIDYAANSLEIT
jgi:clan AA aspartic protease